MTTGRITCAALGLLLAGLMATPSHAEPAPEALAQESEAYVKSTAKETPTQPETIVTRVEEAAKLLAAEGAAAFPKFKGKGSRFLYEGTYIWIHTLDSAEMLVHPIKHKMEGKKLIGLKDKKGKRFFTVMNNLVKEHGEAWVEYYWPKPGTKDLVRKVSYVKRATLPDGREVVIGSGIYNGDPAAMEKLTIH